MHQPRPASAARAAPASSAPDPHLKQKRAGARVGSSNQTEGAWERTFNCEDVDSDLRDFWALVLEGTSRAKLPVNCAPFVLLDANFEPTFVVQHQQFADKKAGSGVSGGGAHVAGMYIDDSSSDAVWAAVQQQIETWPRVVLKRRIADAAPDKGAKALSSTQLLLAQLVSAGTSAANALEVAKTTQHEMVANAQAVRVADTMMRFCQKRNLDADETRKLAEGSASGRRKSTVRASLASCSVFM
jgi:hypothetical protein